MSTDSTITLNELKRMKSAGTKIACLTCYDASFAQVLESAGVDVLLVGDSLGMVLQGHDSTLPVTMDDMVYHAACVARASRRAYRVVDMPYRSDRTPALALENARRLMQDGGADMVKLEGAKIDVVQHLTGHSVPVCGHLGLLPQSVKELGGYHVQARDAESAQRLLDDALALQSAGAGLLVLECIPVAVAARVRAALDIPVIGIGAGADCDGQVLVLHDMLGITSGKRPRFVRNFLRDEASVADAVAAYVRAVRDGGYPGPENWYE